MDVCSANCKLDSESISSFCESPKQTRGYSANRGHLVSDLGHQFTESLNIEDDRDSIDKDNPNSSTEDGIEDIHANDTGTVDSEKCLIKSATFPCSGMSTPLSELVNGQEEGDMTAEVLACNADAKSIGFPCSRSISLPAPLKVASAIKGSREKQGKPLRKLSVTWAPDVYDPVPTAVSHVPSKGQRHRSDSKKNGKKYQKSNGKSSRGSKSKERKPSRKHGGSAKRSYHPSDDNLLKSYSSFHPVEENITACSSGLQASAVDFDIGSTPDQFCGSSFLKKSVTKLHFPVAEAT